MTPAGAIRKSKDCHNVMIIISLQEVIKKPFKDIIHFTGIGICLAYRNNIDFSSWDFYLYAEPMSVHQAF